MVARKAGPQKQFSIGDASKRLQSILINAAEGRRSIADDRDYPKLRGELLKGQVELPPMVVPHPTLDSFVAYIRGIEDKRERVALIRAEFKNHVDGNASGYIDSEGWTGPKRPAEKLYAARTLLPVARASVNSLIESLSEPNPNGAPMMEDRKEALKNLRELHRTLGELLAAVDAGRFDDNLGQDLAAEAARYAKKAARALRDEPLPYVTAALLLGIFTACGFPIGGFMADVAMNVTKHVTKQVRE
jgi:hypothetical protein